MKAFVTGASGFIGGHLVRALLANGWQVRILTHRTSRPNIRGVESLNGDIGDKNRLQEAMAGMDVVFHLAAAVGSAVTDPRAFQAVNVDGTKAVLAAAERTGPVRIVHFSSIGVLGSVRGGETATEDYPPTPRTLYDKTKLAAENIVRKAAAEGLDAVVIRPGWVYGPGDRRTFKFIRAVCRQRFALIAGATARQTPVFIDDLIGGTLLVAAQGQAGAIYHLAGNEILTAEEMARVVASACAVDLPRFRLPKAPAVAAALILEKLFALAKKEAPLNRGKLSFFLDPKAMSSLRAKQELGFAPTIDFVTGMTTTVAWYRENKWL